jgi:hypothetical protein
MPYFYQPILACRMLNDIDGGVTDEGDFAHEFGALRFELGSWIGVGGSRCERGHFYSSVLFASGVLSGRISGYAMVFDCWSFLCT